MTTHAQSSNPGNKRLRPVLTDGDGQEIPQSAKERAAAIKHVPLIVLAVRLAEDDRFLELAELASPRELAARYQPHDGYGRRVFETIAERVVAGEATRKEMRRRLLSLTAFACVSDAPLEPGDRHRFRGLGWREEAVEALLDLGGGRCLAPGCKTVLARHSRGRYCGQHYACERERGGLAAHRHDAAIENVSELLAEVGKLLKVERPRAAA